MTSEANIDSIFCQAVEIASETQRREFVDRVCGDDSDLRARLDKLLAAHALAGSFLPEGDEATIDMPSYKLRSGTQIGPYKLRERLGEGGMGVVWAAEQKEPLRRKVAIKVIKPGMDSEQILARFEAEREALCLMDHPNIARVLDAGTTPQGRPFFVMELIRGVPITEYCDARKMSVPARLSLFTQVCLAVQHAHQKGIIHRDIKPSNVLVSEQDGEPVLKVIDFGVAKALHRRLTEHSVYTGVFQAIGTLAYMSPEQAGLSVADIDTRADVYGLGVLLYELMTGKTPHDKEELGSAAFEEACRIIRETDPSRPSAKITALGEELTNITFRRSTDSNGLCRTLRGDLDWIVMKSLDKNRGRRYGTANDLATDLERYLRNEAIEARPPSRTYQVGKFVSRNRGLVISATTMIAVLVAFGLVASMAAFKFRELRNEAMTNLEHFEKATQDLVSEFIDRAIVSALCGRVDEVEESLEKAEGIGADGITCDAIRGIALLHGGQMREATDKLDEILTKHPDHVIALCGSLWAHYFQMNPHNVAILQHKLATVSPDELDDHERLLLAQTKVWGTLDLPQLIAELDDLIEQHKWWGLAFAVRAEAKASLGMESKSAEAFAGAVEDVEKAYRLLPDSPVILAAGLAVYNMTLEFGGDGRLPDLKIASYESRARDFAEDLNAWPDYVEGRLRRMYHFKLIADNDSFEEERRALTEEGIGGAQSEMVDFVLGKTESAKSFLRRHDHSPIAETIVAIRSAIDDQNESEAEYFASLHDALLPPIHFLRNVDAAIIANRPNLAKELAQQGVAAVAMRSFPSLWRYDFFMLQAAAGDLPAEQLLQKAGPHQLQRCDAHSALGRQAILDGRIDEARGHFVIASDCYAPTFWVTNVSQLYIQLIDKGWFDGRRCPGNQQGTESTPSSSIPDNQMFALRALFPVLSMVLTFGQW